MKKQYDLILGDVEVNTFLSKKELKGYILALKTLGEDLEDYFIWFHKSQRVVNLSEVGWSLKNVQAFPEFRIDNLRIKIAKIANEF